MGDSGLCSQNVLMFELQNQQEGAGPTQELLNRIFEDKILKKSGILHNIRADSSPKGGVHSSFVS